MIKSSRWAVAYAAWEHKTWSMSSWKVAGAPNSPNGRVSNWYKPYGVESTVVS